MAGGPPDWFGTRAPTAVDDEPAAGDDDAGATGQFDFGRIDTRPGPASLAGQRIGRYLLGDLLGEGAMGQVWRATDPQLDRAVAIKVVHPSIAASPDGGARLLREARAMAKLSHPNVVAVHDAGDDGGRLFVAMDLVDGLTLGEWLRAAPTPRPWPAVLARFREAGHGLAAAHAAGVLHRDFKPDNVLIDSHGRVRVADFGLAAFGPGPAPTQRASRVDRQVVSDLTAAGAVLGTSAFMSPEQLRGEAIDARADQFSFCAALYEALYGEHPFLGVEPMTIAALVDAIDRRAVRASPPGDPVPRWLRAAVVRGLDAEPAARWPDMAAVLAALVPPRRGPSVVTVAAVAAVVVAVLAIALAVRSRRPADGAAPAVVTPVRRFDASLASRIALAPDGELLAIATADRVDVRRFDGAQAWSSIEPDGDIDRVAFADADHLLVAHSGPGRLDQIALADGATVELGRWTSADRWLARIDGGDVLARVDGRGWALSLATAAGVAPLAALDHPAPVVATSPDHRRIAVVVERRYDGQIVVLDRAGVVARSAWLPALTAVNWSDDATLVYATGTVARPTLWRAVLRGAGVAPGRVIYQAERGWFGQIVVGGDRILFVDSGSTFRSRIIERSGGAASARDLDPGTVGATLAWMDDGTFLVWNRSSGAIERHDQTGPLAATPARLDGELASATRAGDTLIAALRRDDGRELVAVSLVDGQVRWRLPPGTARTVRCADDRLRPCVVVFDAEDDLARQRIAWLDPATGQVGVAVGPVGRVDDVALDASGTRLLVSDGGGVVRELNLVDGSERRHDVMVGARAIAFDPRGGLLVTGTQLGHHYSLARVDADQGEQLFQSRDELLFMPRAAPTGGAVSVMGRLFLPSLFELPRAAAR